ncbi:MAG: N,N'-diacetyllegionaminic acid synthase [Elusimicrobia bacterium]|nr:N,N'-diacetyllegionaminic acid synthase [Elusimicrobiota bacterium]
MTSPFKSYFSGKPVFVIAEAGVNHNGDINLATQLVDAALSAGADAVKFQTFIPEQVMSVHAPKAAYQEKNTGKSGSQIDMVRKLQLSFDAFRKIKRYCDDKGILFISTPFDFESALFLRELNMPFNKIPSGEITNFPFLQFIGAEKKPVVLSTGMSTLAEVKEAVAVLEKAGTLDITLLHCVSMYPADPKDTNLKAMQTMEKILHKPVGLSDHTPGIEVALAAVAMGARVIEKHFTLDHNLPGPDHKASLTPNELESLVRGVRIVESALGNGEKKPTSLELDTAAVARRSLIAAKPIAKGTIVTRDMIAIKRPGTGLPPRRLEEFVGRKSKASIQEDELLTEDMFV